MSLNLFNRVAASFAVATIAGFPASAQSPVPTPPPASTPAAATTPASTPPTAAAPAAVVPAAAPLAAAYTPHRVYDTKRKRFIDLETMIAAIARADAAFLGEFHDDPGTHRLQRAILEGTARRREGKIVLSLEMFERDVQPRLNAYLANEIDEPAFLANSRPWPNYPSDYRPLVEFAKANQWPVVGGNIPRRIASQVARRGLIAIDSLPEADRPFAAASNSCPRDDYFKKFDAVMGDMAAHGMRPSPDERTMMVSRMYESQCAKDEAMGEAIAAAMTEHNTLVIHANGAFHSDYRLGTVERVRRRAPRAKMVVVTFAPVADLDAANGREKRQMGDYVVFTLAPQRP
jgi:uncharacterized iron-regulated protein